MALRTEIPGVNNAVQKLQELAHRMKTVDFGFQGNDVDNIDKVIDALYELETERKNIHDELEKESITSSVLRHKLKFLPGNIREECMDAVMSARMSNAKVLLDLQEELKQMNNTITALEKRSRELEQDNAVLSPEREQLRSQHEEIISQLNRRMAEKAGMQIGLNETRDKVSQANQDIVDLEDGILQLKEDLIQERTEARQEKKRLKKAVTDTFQKTRDQKDQNVFKRKELDGYQEKLMDSEGKLDTVRKGMRRYETSRAKLEGEERALGQQLSKQLKMNDQMRIRGADILNERVMEEMKFKRDQQALLDTIRQFQEDIESDGLKSEELQTNKLELLHDLKQKQSIRDDDAERVAELDGSLQAAKEALNTKAEDVGAMKRENIEMSEEIEQLGESHKAVMAQLHVQIEEYKEQLSNERRDRLEIQALKDKVSKNLDDLKTENQTFMTEMTSVVQDGKKQHQDLSNEGMKLQRQLKEDEEEIDVLSRNLDEAQGSFQTMFDDYQKRTDMMEGEVQRLELSLESKKQELEVKTPLFEQLEVYFKERNEGYDKTKKAIVEMKNKKQGLEDQIKRLKKDKDDCLDPQVQMRKDLKDKRAKLMKQLRAHGADTQDMETQILNAGCKLRSVVEENHKFHLSCKKLEDELDQLEKEMADNELITATLTAKLTSEKQELMKKWETDSMMQEFFASRDEATAEAFQRLLSRTEKRENKIDMITERLKEELSCLGGFLNTISNRRPPGSKKKKVRVQSGFGKKHGHQQRHRSRSRSQSQERGKSRDSRHGSHSGVDQRRREQSKSPQRSPAPSRKEPSLLSSRHSTQLSLREQ